MFFSGLQTAAVGCSIPELVQLIDLPPYFLSNLKRATYHLSGPNSNLPTYRSITFALATHSNLEGKSKIENAINKGGATFTKHEAVQRSSTATTKTNID
jgi:hypothetical protein